MNIRFLMEQGYFRPDEILPRHSDNTWQSIVSQRGKIGKQDLLWILLQKKITTSFMEISSSKLKKVKFLSHIASSERLLIF